MESVSSAPTIPTALEPAHPNGQSRETAPRPRSGTGLARPNSAARPRKRSAWTFGLALACAGLCVSDLLLVWERDVYDVLCRAGVASAERSADIGLILLDEATLDWGRDRFERGGDAASSGLPPAALLFPWNRSVYDFLINYVANCGADVVALDIELSGPHPGGDRSGDEGLGLTSAMQNKVGKPFVVHALNFESAAARQTEVAALDQLQRACLTGAAVEVAGWRDAGVPFDRSDVGPYSNPVLPYRSILAAFADAPTSLRMGAVTAQPDPDGVIRRARLMVAWEGRCYPSLGLAAALARLQTREGPVTIEVANGALELQTARARRRLPLTTSGDLLVRWRDDGREDPTDPAVGRYPTWPAHRVLRSAMKTLGIPGWQEPPAPDGYFLEPAAFAGRIVFLGANAAGLRDLKATPVAEDYPGVKIHAAVAEAALTGDAVRRASQWWRGALAAGVTLFTALVTLRARSQVWRSVLVAGVAVSLVALAATSFRVAGVWLDVVAPLLGIAIAYSTATTVNFLGEGRRSRAIAGIFQHFAPAEVVQQLIAHPDALALAGDTREITSFFSDIRGFTSLSNTPQMQADPGLLTAHLNAYLTEMTRAITECGGTVDKYIGDAVVAVFGAPLALANHAHAACRAALLCQQRIAEFNARAVAEGLPALPTRIGLYSGAATLGLVGSEHRLSYTAIGSTVNIASRMEGVNKAYGTWVLAGGATVALAKDGLRTRLLDRVRVPGLLDDAPPLEVHQVLAVDAEGASGIELPGEPLPVEFLRGFEAARSLYDSRRFAAAGDAFERLLANRDDPPSRVLAVRCRAWAAAPPPADWDGSYRLDAK
jgi:adenylate cyclase